MIATKSGRAVSLEMAEIRGTWPLNLVIYTNNDLKIIIACIVLLSELQCKVYE